MTEKKGGRNQPRKSSIANSLPVEAVHDGTNPIVPQLHSTSMELWAIRACAALGRIVGLTDIHAARHAVRPAVFIPSASVLHVNRDGFSLGLGIHWLKWRVRAFVLLDDTSGLPELENAIHGNAEGELRGAR